MTLTCFYESNHCSFHLQVFVVNNASERIEYLRAECFRHLSGSSETEGCTGRQVPDRTAL